MAHDPAPADERMPAGAVAPRGQPAHRDGADEAGADPLEERVGGKRVGVGEEQHRLATGRCQAGRYLDGRAVSRVADGEVVDARATAWKARGEQAHGRHALELAGRPDDGLAGRARERTRLEQRDDRGRRVLGLGDVLGREEQERQVGRRARKAVAHVGGHVLGRSPGVGQRRDRRRGAGAHPVICQSVSTVAVVEAEMKQSRSALPVSPRAASAWPAAIRACTSTATWVKA